MKTFEINMREFKIDKSNLEHDIINMIDAFRAKYHFPNVEGEIITVQDSIFYETGEEIKMEHIEVDLDIEF